LYSAVSCRGRAVVGIGSAKCGCDMVLSWDCWRDPREAVITGAVSCSCTKSDEVLIGVDCC